MYTPVHEHCESILNAVLIGRIKALFPEIHVYRVAQAISFSPRSLRNLTEFCLSRLVSSWFHNHYRPISAPRLQTTLPRCPMQLMNGVVGSSGSVKRANSRRGLYRHSGKKGPKMDITQRLIHVWAVESSKISQESGRITEVNGHSISVDFWEQGFYSTYTLQIVSRRDTASVE